MARPPQNPQARFADVKPIWDHASANNGATWRARDANDAIRILMRLNMYRRLMRDNAPDGFILEDLFAVSRRGEVITIKRREIVAGQMFTLDGRPINVRDDPVPLPPRHVDDTEQGKRLQINPDKPLDLETA